MATRNILNYLGEVVGSLTLPDSSTEAEWAIILAPYAEPPPPPLTQMESLEQKAEAYILFGEKLYNTIQSKVWAINTLAISQGVGPSTQQLLALLSASSTLEQTLKSGSLATAKIVITQLVNSMPQYLSVGTYANNAIDEYMRTP